SRAPGAPRMAGTAKGPRTGLIVVVLARRRLRPPAAASLVLRRRWSRCRVFRGRQPAGAVGVGTLELVDRFRRPFLEAQRAVAVGVELGERLVARGENLVRLDFSVLVLVGAREASLLAALGACLGRLELSRSHEGGTRASRR